jgi:hypothetical protein
VRAALPNSPSPNPLPEGERAICRATTMKAAA